MELIDAVKQCAPYLESWLEFQRRRHRVPGVQVAVRVGQELVASFALGAANLDTGEELTTDHLFHIASHSKTFTATAIFQLLEAGALRLDDPVVQWIGELADSPAAEMTIRELLGHQSGINRDSDAADFWQLRGDFPELEALLDMARADAIDAPNEHFKYSNVGYSLLGEIVARASGMPFEQYCRERIITPLGLERTGAEMTPELEPSAAACHSARIEGDDPVRVLQPTYARAMAAATGFYSTAEEVSAYMTAHAKGREELLSEASKRLMQRRESHIPKGGPHACYGLGLDIGKVGERTVVGHSGGWTGHITRTWLDPESGLCVSVLTNAMATPASEWAAALIKLIDLAANPPECDEVPGDIDIDTFTGRFATLWGVADIVNLGGRLVELAPANPGVQPVGELTVKDADTLENAHEDGYGTEGELVHVDRRADGSIEKIRSGATAWPIDDYRRMMDLPL